MESRRKLEEKIEQIKRIASNEEKRIAEYNLLITLPQTDDVKLQIKNLLSSSLERYKRYREELENLEWLRD